MFRLTSCPLSLSLSFLSEHSLTKYEHIFDVLVLQLVQLHLKLSNTKSTENLITKYK